MGSSTKVVQQAVNLSVVGSSPTSPDSNIWKGFKFPMGTFIVWHQDGRMAWGKCNPITKEILEWNEVIDERTMGKGL